MSLFKLKVILTVFFVSTITVSFSQQNNVSALLEKALLEKNYTQADSLLQSHLTYLFTNNLLDSLPYYIRYVGKIEEKKTNPEGAVKKVNQFIEKIKAYSPSTALLTKFYAEAGEYYGSVSMNELAYQTTQQAHKYALQTPNVAQEILGSIDSDLGTFAYRMGDVSLSQFHHRKAIKVFLASKNPDYESLYSAANNVGSLMWLSSKMDSAIYYFNIAFNALSKTTKTPINQYYRPAVLQNNMSALYNMQGETTRAIEAMRSCIENLKKYLSIPESVPKKPNTIGFQFEAVDNLAGIYKELGDYSQAKELLLYSYQQKQINSDEDPTGIFKSQILLGQLYLAMKDHNKAMEFLKQGLDNISKADGDHLFWQADASSALALLYDEQNNKSLAAHYYEKADSLYEASLQGQYDDIYLEFLRNASLFYAENNQLPIALTKANKGFNYVKKTQGAETLLAFYQLLNMSAVYLQAGKYQQALDFSNKGIAVVNKNINHSKNLLDSVKTELQKPKAILLKAKAQYYLHPTKNTANLSALIKDLNLALSIIEKRKNIIHDSKDIGLLVADHNDLLNFIKKITLDLYNLTQEQGYIDQLMDLHESGIYNRIRSRLDKTDSIRFAHIPADVQEKEKHLKSNIKSALEKNDAHGKNVSDYFKAIDEWNAFQQMVKKQYPHYYKMRYESIFKSLGEIQKSIPEKTSVIRYFFIDKDLFAVVIDRQNKKLFLLQVPEIDKNIMAAGSGSSEAIRSVEAFYTLYQQLWAPLAKDIRYSKLVIIPDGILYNLNFELLTPQKIKNFEELASHSLLSKYTISYHYSMALIGQKRQTNISNNFVAFAPGFSDEEKKRYRSTVKDSFQVDQTYVSLLPQPFTIDFVEKAKHLLNGKAYINNESTASSFKNNAGNHKIIHIGTHGESNNLSPEFSRLIFSKNSSQAEQNSIFLHELYNCDLNSELAILTACESGKPGYEDGEGMISLAHAFNYAGSESIITGLWKIDEKVTNMLMDDFYKNLMKGMDKDEALRQAKLQYLKTAKGRMLAPQFWAGLVLMGDTAPIQLEKQRPVATWWWAAVAVMLLGVTGLIVYKKRKFRS